jgi:hypothetical protein
MFFFSLALQPQFGPWPTAMKLFHFGFLDRRQSVGLLGRMISSSQGPYLYINTEKRTHTHTQTLNIHALSGIRTHNPGFRASEDSTWLRLLGYRDRPWLYYYFINREMFLYLFCSPWSTSKSTTYMYHTSIIYYLNLCLTYMSHIKI